MSGQIILTSEVPGGHQGKDDIERRVRSALSAFPGRWRVTLRYPRTPWTQCWGFVEVHGPSLHIILIVDRPEDLEARIAEEVRFSVRLGAGRRVGPESRNGPEEDMP